MSRLTNFLFFVNLELMIIATIYQTGPMDRETYLTFPESALGAVFYYDH